MGLHRFKMGLRRCKMVRKTPGSPFSLPGLKVPFAPSPNHSWEFTMFGLSPRTFGLQALLTFSLLISEDLWPFSLDFPSDRNTFNTFAGGYKRTEIAEKREKPQKSSPISKERINKVVGLFITEATTAKTHPHSAFRWVLILNGWVLGRSLTICTSPSRARNPEKTREGLSWSLRPQDPRESGKSLEKDLSLPGAFRDYIMLPLRITN